MEAIQPNLFIPGAAKSGTTSLHQLLDLHPDVTMSSTKEPVYWNSVNYISNEKINRYNALFNSSNSKIIGESTTSYMYYSNFILRIKKHFKKSPKFIFILRNPIDRCYSHYWYLVGRGQENRSFKTSFTNDAKREFSNYGDLPNYYYHFGRYAHWLEAFYTNFESKNIKIITLEDLKINPLKTINSCFLFLSISELTTLSPIKSNVSVRLKYPKLYHLNRKILAGKYSITKFSKCLIPKKQRVYLKNRLQKNTFFNTHKPLNYPELSEQDRSLVKSYYENDVKRLKKLTGHAFNGWRDFND